MVTPPRAQPRLLYPILVGGLLAGLLDISAAITQTVLRGGTPIQLLQIVAAGWMGRTAALAGGLGTAAIGLLSHFVIALGAATVFVLAARRLPALSARWLIAGPLYGMVVWAVMQFVVLPLSAFPPITSRSLKPTVIALLIHIFCVGLPVAWGSRRR